MHERRFSSKRLYQARLKAGMSQDDLAYRVRELSGKRLKPSQSSISDYENGRNVPSGDALPVIAEATGQSIEFFYASGGDDDEKEDAALPSIEDFLRALRPLFVPNRERAAA